MASGTSMLPFASGAIKMRWREPYVTEGLNKKLAGVVPRGVYRGFRLAYNGAPMLVSVLADPDKGDHIAVYETDTAVADRYSMRIEQTAGDFTIDLDNAAWYGLTVYIAIYAEYSTLAVTAADIRVYTEAEYNGAVEKDELIILGTVNLPGAPAIIGVAEITGSYRTLPWSNQSSDVVPWLPLLTNPSFEQGGSVTGVQGDVVPGWVMDPEGSSTPMQWSVVWSSSAYDGRNYLELEALSTSAYGISASSVFALDVLPAQRIRWKFAYKIVASASIGSLLFKLKFDIGEPGGFPTNVVAATVDLTAAPGGWVELEGILEVPANDYVLHEVYFDCSPAQYSSAGVGFQLDAVQCWVERSELQASPIDAMRVVPVHAGKLILRKDGSLNITESHELLGETGGASFQRTDQVVTAAQPTLRVKGQLDIGENLLDTAVRAALPRVTEKFSDTYAYTALSQVNSNGAVGNNVLDYVSSGGAVSSVVGAQWDGTQWASNAAELASFRVDQTENRMIWSSYTSMGSAVWADGAWLEFLRVGYGTGMVFGDLFSAATPIITCSQKGSEITYIKSVVGDGPFYHRQYVHGSYLEWSTNAFWTGTNFVQSDSAAHSFSNILLANGLGVIWSHKEIGASAWLN